MKNKKSKKNEKINMSFIIISVCFILMIIVVIAITNKIKSYNTIKNQSNDKINVDIGETIQKNSEDAELELIKGMTERARIEFYATKFINYVEFEEYEKAYNLLNKTYKQNYFPNINKFIEYAKNNFSKMMDVQYTNFERIGDVYVIWITVTDAINGAPNSGKKINIVVKENNYNDFELSFSAN